MKRLAALLLALAACGGSYRAPPSVPSVAMPAGADLKPFDAASPGLARPSQITIFNGKAYVALQNYDAAYTVRGPGLLAVLDPVTGKLTTIDLGGASGRACLYPFWIRESSGKLYVTCTGDAFGSGDGKAIVEVDPATATVTRTAPTPVAPAGLAITADRIWFGDAQSGNLYWLDRTSLGSGGAPLAIGCPAGGSASWVTVSDVQAIEGDVYAICANTDGGVLSRVDGSAHAVNGSVQVGALAGEFAETGDGRIAVLAAGENKLRLVTRSPALTAADGYTYGSATSVLQDIRARGQFLFTVATGSNTVQKLDLTKTGAQMLVGEANVGTGAGPYAVAPLDDDQVLVANQGNQTVVSVGADCSGGRLCWTTPK